MVKVVNVQVKVLAGQMVVVIVVAKALVLDRNHPGEMDHGRP